MISDNNILSQLSSINTQQPSYQYLKECFDKIKKHRFSLTTFEITERNSDNHFKTIAELDDKIIATGTGKSKKDSRTKASNKCIEILVETNKDIADYFYSLIDSHKKKPIENVQSNNNSYNMLNQNGDNIRKLVKVQDDSSLQSQIVKQQAKSFLEPSLINFYQFDDVYNVNHLQISNKTIQLIEKLSCPLIIYQYCHEMFQKINNLIEKDPRLAAAIQNMSPVGSFALNTMRVNRLELDLIFFMNLELIDLLIQVLERNMQQIKCIKLIKEDQNILQLISQESFLQDNKELKLVIIIILESKAQKSYPHQIHHTFYMAKINENLNKNNSAQQTLLLLRQWRDQSKLRIIIPIDILDFLASHLTNKFSFCCNPYIILNQIIYLLQQDILSQIANYDSSIQRTIIPENPFIQSTSFLHLTMIKSLKDLTVVIQEEAKKWSRVEIDLWIEKQLNQ